jgi:peptidoglycan/xylan/chitin deacetylase (PgdA/CDA1 family)
MTADAAHPGSFEVFYGHGVPREAPPLDVGPEAANAVTSFELERFLQQRAGQRALGWRELLSEMGRGCIAPRDAFLLTLDDGYRDNLTDALPMLERLGVPVLIFVTTGFIDGTIEPAERTLARIVAGCAITLRLADGRALACGSMVEKQAAYEALRPAVKRKSPAARRRLLEALAAHNAVPLGAAEGVFLNWDEVRRLDRHPLVCIGAHTHSHPLLTTLSPAAAYGEISASKAALESRLGHAIDCFAYPYGGHNRLVRWLTARAGFKAAFATGQRRLAGGTPLDPLRIPRVDLKEAVAQSAGVAAQAA